ncbi:MAG: HPr(Ser) kinase/phosphatase [Clostridiales bacterium]|nr:HPr(Ser) kinase/phosphatase [Clostridiales bacterium]
MGTVVLSDMISRLSLEVVGSYNKKTVELHNSNFNRPGLQLVGYFDAFPYGRVQIVGKVEMSYLNSLGEDTRRLRVEQYMDADMPFIIFSRGYEVPEIFISAAKKHDIPLFRSPLETSDLIRRLVEYIDDTIAEEETIHGVMMDIHGEGVLIMGESGIGKSEAALELVKRGHRLVADDGVIIRRLHDDTLEGKAAPIIKNLMEIRGVGLIDVRAVFGVGTVIDSKKLSFVIKMELWHEGMNYERIGNKTQYINILGVDVSSITIPVRPGRNMATVIETAARSVMLRENGYDPAKLLEERIKNI